MKVVAAYPFCKCFEQLLNVMLLLVIINSHHFFISLL